MAAILPTTTKGVGRMLIDLAGVTSTDGGGIGSVANPEGKTLAILRTQLYVDTPSTGAANLNAGIGAAETTDASDIISALAINGSISGKIYNGNTIQGTTKTEITAPALWTAAKFLNFTGSGDSSGFVGKFYVEYIPLS